MARPTLTDLLACLAALTGGAGRRAIRLDLQRRSAAAPAGRRAERAAVRTCRRRRLITPTASDRAAQPPTLRRAAGRAAAGADELAAVEPSRRGSIQSQPLAPPPGAQQAARRRRRSSSAGAAAARAARRCPACRPATASRAARRRSRPIRAPQPGDEVVVEPPPQRIANPTAVFSGLDKITGRITSFDVAINETVQFGALQVTPRVCYSRPPTETPQTDAFVEVDEVTLQGEIKRIFTGWMFAASPGLHAVEHPIYDVWLTDCKGGKNPAVAEVPPSAAGSRKQPAPKPPRSRSRSRRRARSSSRASCRRCASLCR